jgi:hypothetical protein
MSLSGELALRLDAGGSLADLQVDAGAALGDMDAVTLPDLSADFAQARERSEGFDLSEISSGVQRALAELGPAVASLPAANDTLEPLNRVIDLAQRLAALDLPNSVRELAAAIDGQLAGSGDFLDKLTRLSDLLSGNSHIQGARELLTLFGTLSGTKLGADDLRLPDLVPAIVAGAKSVGGLMHLQTLLEEGGRLAAVVGIQLDPASIAAGVEQVEGQLGLGTSAPLAELVAGLDIADATQVQAARQAIGNATLQVAALSKAVAEGMAFGEATLVHLDVDGLKSAVRAAAIELGDLDLTPLERGVRTLADRLRPLFDIDLTGAPATTLDGWLTQLEGRVAQIQAGIEALDVQRLAAPITQGIAAVMALPAELTKALQALRLSVQQALEGIRKAVEAIPLDGVAERIRRVLEPIADALAFIGELVGRIQAALGTAVASLQTALEASENAVDKVKQTLEALFREAKGYVDALALEGVIGDVSDQIKTFADTLAQADMSPYFDAVVGAVDSAADVVDKVPFEMLPDSMEQEVVDVVRPVKQTDIAGLRRRIEGLLQIGPDGEFQLRPDLEAALEQIQEKYDELLATLRTHDPRRLLAELDAELSRLQARIQDLVPSVALDPVQSAIDDIKGAIGGFDLDAELQPLRDGFDQVLTKVDTFQPGALLQEAEEKLAGAREDLFGGLQLERWNEELNRLRDQALALVDPLDPEQLEPQLASLLTDLRSQAAGLPRLELGFALGSLVSAVLGGGGQPRADSFGAVLDWLQGASGTQALATLARDAAAEIESAFNKVEQVDPQAIVLRLQPALAAVRAAVSSLPEGSAKLELSDCAVALDIETPMRGFADQRQRYLAALGRGRGAMRELANSGFSQVDLAVERLRLVLAPLDFAREFGRELLRALGLEGLDQGLQEVIARAFAVATPARLAGILRPVFSALKGRVQDLLDGFLDPVLGAIADLQALEEQLSLSALTEELDAIHGAVRAQIEQIHPDQLLGETVSAFTGTQAQVLEFDPFGPLEAGLTALRESSTRVLGKLDAEAILATPLAVYDELLSALEQLSLERLLEPVLDTLDALASKVSKGLEDTTGAFQRLQDALPDSVGGTTISASASVGT